ncbi:MAG: hypothetical protein AAGA85_20055 [Bacteroidota bacterium]
MNTNKSLFYLFLFLGLGLFVSCSDDDEDDGGGDDGEETITQVVLTFTPTRATEFDVVTATWFDADGEGTGAPTIDDITLVEGADYEMSVTLTNTLETPPEDVTAEIEMEDDEHQFFFSFTDGIFGDPMGDGNIDNKDDAINYNDFDANNRPLGLSTQWTPGEPTTSAGQFRIVLKHQPDLKSDDSDFNTGGTDIDITFNLNVAEDPNAEEETITQVVLTFTPAGGGDALSFTWLDADGEGVGEPAIDDVNLAANTEYEMSIMLTNTLEDPDEDITEEIEREDDEHQFFFSFTADIFSNPAGDGNKDTRDDPLNYNDEDDNMLPVGLSTQWTTGAATTSEGVFNVVLKHQPDLKTATSDSNTGSTDIDINFPINIQ